MSDPPCEQVAEASHPHDVEGITISVLFTLLGAIGFLAGSLLMLPKAISQGEQ